MEKKSEPDPKHTKYFKVMRFIKLFLKKFVFKKICKIVKGNVRDVLLLAARE